jgi:hypothetical protein
VIADRNGTMATARHRDPAVGHQPDAEAERELAREGATLNQRRTPEPGKPRRQSSVGG